MGKGSARICNPVTGCGKPIDSCGVHKNLCKCGIFLSKKRLPKLLCLVCKKEKFDPSMQDVPTERCCTKIMKPCYEERWDRSMSRWPETGVKKG